jgi:hypothetical protein
MGVPSKNKMHFPSVKDVVRWADFGVGGGVGMTGHVARSERFGRASRMRCARRSDDVGGEGGRIGGWGFVSMWRWDLGGNR